MYIYKSLFSINKLNQNLVSFACSHCVGGLGICGGSRRYGFVQEPSNRLLVCVRSGEYVLEGSFGHLYTYSIVFCIEMTPSNASLYQINFTCVMN